MQNTITKNVPPIFLYGWLNADKEIPRNRNTKFSFTCETVQYIFFIIDLEC